MSNPRVAFLGLGIMGSGMARRLVDAGLSVTVWNRNPQRAEALRNAGARVGRTPREAAAEADVVIAMVADDGASREVWLGQEGVVAGWKRGALGIECSTLTVAWVKELAKAINAAGGSFADAPVTGSKGAAAAGDLNFLVGANATDHAQIDAVLKPMSRSVVHLGPPGSGAFVKLVNNFLAGVQVAAFAEATGWLERGGVDRVKALGLITEGAPGSPIVKLMHTRMTARDYAPNFFLRLMAKDLGYAIEEGARSGVPLLTATAALERFRAAVTAGLGEQDMAAVVEPIRPARG